MILSKHQFNACGECADGTPNSVHQSDCGKQHKRLCWNVIINTYSGFRSCGSVACMSEVIGAFLRTEFGGEGTDPTRETRNGSLGCFS